MTDKKRLIDRCTALVLLAMSIGIFVTGSGYTSGSEILPRIVSLILGAVAVAIFVRSIWGREYEFEDSGSGAAELPLLLVIALVAAIVLYTIGVRFVGYITSTLVFLPLSCWFLGLRRPLWVILGTLLFTAGTYWVFTRVFLIPLPAEWFTRL